LRTGSSCCATGSRASRHLGQFDHGSRLLASVCEFHRHKAGDRDSEMEWPNNRLQTGQRPGERIDRNNIPITCGSQRREAESSKKKGSDYTVMAVTAPVLGFEQSVDRLLPQYSRTAVCPHDAAAHSRSTRPEAEGSGSSIVKCRRRDTIPASNRDALLCRRRLCGVELAVALLDVAGPLMPSNGGADMVGARALACSGDFLLRFAGC
jgi:hypothetical protein